MARLFATGLGAAMPLADRADPDARGFRPDEGPGTAVCLELGGKRQELAPVQNRTGVVAPLRERETRGIRVEL